MRAIPGHKVTIGQKNGVWGVNFPRFVEKDGKWVRLDTDHFLEVIYPGFNDTWKILFVGHPRCFEERARTIEVFRDQIHTLNYPRDYVLVITNPQTGETPVISFDSLPNTLVGTACCEPENPPHG